MSKVVNVFSTHSEVDNLSRSQMVDWVNDTLQSQCVKIEELGTGAAYCLLMDVLYPGCIPMNRIKLNTNLEHEYIQNFKLLQQCFKTLGVERSIPVDKLVKVKFQENWMFVQWFHKFFMANKHSGDAYDALEARGGRPFGSGASVRTGGARGAAGGSGAGGGGDGRREPNPRTSQTPRFPGGLRNNRSFHRRPE